MKIDILLPTFNNSKSIRKAVESVLEQTYGNFRLIIINDGSTDDTKSILTELSQRDKRIYVLNNSINLGIGKSLALGLELVTAPFTARMDGDDEWLPEKLSKQIEYFKFNPEYAVVGTAVLLLNAKEDRHKFRQTISRPNGGLSSLVNDYVYHPTVLMRTPVLRKVGGYDFRLRKSEDKDLWIRILNCGYSIGNLQEPLIYYDAANYDRSWSYIREKIKSDWMIFRKHRTSTMLFSWLWLSVKQVARKVCF